MKDKIGFEIPAHLVALWQSADEIGREICRDVQTIYQGLEKRLAAGDLVLAEITPQKTVIDLKYIWRCLQQVIPWAVCPYDLGDEEKRAGCPACYGKGYLSKFRWDRVVPKDKKATHIELIKTDGSATN